MGIKKQFEKIKENWLIAAIIIVLLIFMSGGTNIVTDMTSQYAGGLRSYAGYDMAAEESYIKSSAAYYPMPSGDFAPEITERKIVKTAYMTNEVKRGTFKEAETKFKAIIKTSDSYLLNEDVNRYGKGINQYYTGYYSIKVETEKYDAVIAQLKEIGEVKSFSEGATDVTGQYTDLNVELEAEKERLKRYQDMYKEATKTEDKINLNDRIFDQERRVKYLEEAIANIDTRVDYSTISFTLQEKQSEYTNIVLVKLSEMIRNFVNSFNNLVNLVIIIIPWAIAIVLITWTVKLVKRKKK